MVVIFESAVVGTSSSLPPLFGRGGGLVCESVNDANLLSDHFASSSMFVDLPLTCHPYPSLITLAFRSNVVRRLLSEMDPYGGKDPFGIFPFFLKIIPDVLTPVVAYVLRSH